MVKTNAESFFRFFFVFICSLGVFPNKNVQCICSRWAMNSWILLCHRRPKLITWTRTWLLLASGVVLQTVIYKGLYGIDRFFLKEIKNVMFLNKIDLPYCLVVFFVVCPRLRPFWSVFGELALFWCSTAKRKEKDKAEQWFPECPSLEANNSAGKLSPASILPGIQSRDVAVPCPFSRFAVSPTDRSLVMLLFFARSASKFRTRLFQTALDPFTDRIVCRVTKISPARVAHRAYGLFVCLSTAGRWNTTRQ